MVRARAGPVLVATYGQAYALARRNAQACENAEERSCTCICGGRFHGKTHPAVFVAEYAAKLVGQAFDETQQSELFDFPASPSNWDSGAGGLA